MNGPRHMAPPRPVRRLVALLVLWVVLFVAAAACSTVGPVDGECGGETDCSQVRP